MNTIQQNDKTAKVERLLRRTLEGIGSLLGIITSSCLLYKYFTAPALPSEHLPWQVVISVEFFIAMFIATCVTLVRAVAAPKWLEDYGEKSSGGLRLIVSFSCTGHVTWYQ
jgi:hypothetical protein